MRRRSSALVSAALFVALGLAAAFLVSALAGRGDEEPAGTGLLDPGAVAEDRASIRVEVLNGAGVGGLARDGTYRLRSEGFDVVFFGNAGRFDHARSVAIDRTGDLDRARAVAAALGIDSVTTGVDPSLMLEVTVILGADWPPEPPPERGWGDRIRALVPGDSTAEPSTPRDSAARDPGATDPTATDPTATEPTATDPTATDPTATDPTATDPAAADPAG